VNVEPVRIDVDQLAEYIQWKIDEGELSLRGAARQAQVSVSTLSRILRKRKNHLQPDMETLAKIIRWVGVPMEKIMETAIGRHEDRKAAKDTLEEIRVHLRADRNLSPEAARAIAHLVQVAYKQFARPKGD
jgi:transcriptional regulator with XRE-family HTH domain